MLCPPAAPAGQSLRLPSGGSVEILDIGPLHSTDGWTALRLQYRTSRTLTDDKALRAKADDIWNRFQADADHGGYAAAIVTAHGPATANESYGFTFEKLAGSWRAHEGNERARSKLDADFVRDFVDRIDLVMHRNEMRSPRLYMAND